MASSNRHWPSMFKSKPCDSHHQWQHDINSSLITSGCNRTTPYTSSVTGCDERTPEPKPRWNPKPEQIRILEAIFNSGMVNPPRDEIRKIRAQLQEYGQVGDANVFYWFQNRKSRSKHKLRHLQKQNQNNPSVAATAPSSSSSSSEKSSPKSTTSMGFPNVSNVSSSQSGSVNHTYFQSQGEIFPEPFFFPVQPTGGFSFSELSNVVQVPENTVGPCTSLLLSELIMNHGGGASKKYEEEKAMKVHDHHHLHSAVTTHTVIPPSSTAVTVPISPISQIPGVGGPAKSTVFINDVAFEVGAGPFNVREAFGDDAVLIHSTGQPVLTNDWGVTVHSLQHGEFYYLI